MGGVYWGFFGSTHGLSLRYDLTILTLVTWYAFMITKWTQSLLYCYPIVCSLAMLCSVRLIPRLLLLITPTLLLLLPALVLAIFVLAFLRRRFFFFINLHAFFFFELPGADVSVFAACVCCACLRDVSACAISARSLTYVDISEHVADNLLAVSTL
jgi:hypothetical protein